MDLHGVIRGQCFADGAFAVHIIQDQGQRLAADPLHILIEHVQKPGPRPDGTSHRGKTDQVVLFDHAQQVTEAFQASHVTGLTDGLTQSLLQGGGQQKLSDQLMKLVVLRHEYGP